MIYKMVTDLVRPGKTHQYLEFLRAALPQMSANGKLEACWSTDDDTAYSGFGILNQVVHVWLAPDDAGVVAVDLQAIAPEGRALLVSHSVEELVPAPFMKGMEPQATWSMYELAVDTCLPGTTSQMLAAWEQGLAEREFHGPLAACWTCRTGDLNRIIHVWGCPGLRNRERIRNQSWKPGVWPPARDLLASQQNCLLVPALFSADEGGRQNVTADLATTAPTYVPPPVAGKPPGR